MSCLFTTVDCTHVASATASLKDLVKLLRRTPPTCFTNQTTELFMLPHVIYLLCPGHGWSFTHLTFTCFLITPIINQGLLTQLLVQVSLGRVWEWSLGNILYQIVSGNRPRGGYILYQIVSGNRPCGVDFNVQSTQNKCHLTRNILLNHENGNLSRWASLLVPCWVWEFLFVRQFCTDSPMVKIYSIACRKKWWKYFGGDYT